ncbi:DGQHR domain-containing protein [Pectobacterium sp. CHL-2024]|uniref:DGQHR domain-containing protein n=1 Tax=Pectobacterium TaxID=122277 RepID=UPI0033145E67
MKVKYIEVNQPIGTFYLTSIRAIDLLDIVRVDHRRDFEFGVQRDKSSSRVSDIAKYTGEPDATFPTPIIISVDESSQIKMDDIYFYFEREVVIGDVIDGQHRLWGIKNSSNAKLFDLPVVLMFNLTNEEKAYVFSIINSKQTRVNPSIVYDLFALAERRSPQKTCHEIARGMNSNSDSPFHNRLKMLGKKEKDQDNASLSQSTFIKYLMQHISKKPDDDARKLKMGEELETNDNCVLRNYFIEENDVVIQKIILNFFSAIRDVYEKEWETPQEYSLSKLTGYAALMKAFPYLYEKGVAKKKLDHEFMLGEVKRMKRLLDSKGVTFKSGDFGTSEAEINKLAKLIIEALR